MCYPPYSWQLYDIDFRAAEFQEGRKLKNARITLRHNGVLVRHDVEVPHTTTSAIVQPSPPPPPLQPHGRPNGRYEPFDKLRALRGGR